MTCSSNLRRWVHIAVFLAKTDYPLYGGEEEFREWCEVMNHYWVELDVPEIHQVCREVSGA